MTELADEQTAATPQEEERPLLKRTFETVELNADGRNVEILCAPFNKPATVADPPDFKPYREAFLPGAFQRAIKAPNRVLLDFEHQTQMSGVLGRGAAFEERSDALYGRFRMLEHTDGDKALALIAEEALNGASVMFKPFRHQRSPDGVIQRTSVILDRVALCRSPAYEDARVLAVRSQELELEEAVAVEVVSDLSLREDLAQRVASLGVTPLLIRAVVTRPWDGSAARFSDEEYQRSCLIDRGGDAPAKERCSLPVLEPNGDLNVNALAQAAARLNQVQGASPEMKAAAARKLVRYYRMANRPAPPNVMNMAAA